MNRQQRRAAARRAASPEVVALLQAALASHRAGRAAEAEAGYRQVLAMAPGRHEPLYLLGMLLLQGGRVAEALELLDASIAADDGFAAPFVARGTALARLGRHEAALASLEAALALDPDMADAHLQKTDVLVALGRHAEALASLERGLGLRPEATQAWSNHGMLLAMLGRDAEAVASFDRALAADPEAADAWTNRGNALHKLGRLEEAAESHARALALRPDHAEALGNLGAALTDLGRPEEGLARCEQALALRPDMLDALINRGVALGRLGRPAEAVASYDRALALRPDSAEALSNRGLALTQQRRLEEARADYERALALRPDYPDARLNRGVLRLLTGDFAGGWPDYEWRWHIRRPTSPTRGFAQPQWHGESLAGRTLLLHAEQGFGDTVQFGRYVALAAARAEAEGGRVVLEVPASLRELMAGWLSPIQVVTPGEELPAFDLHCPLLSLPLAFGTTAETIPPMPRPLRADPARVAAWAPLLPPAGRRRIGLAWSGNPGHTNDRNRSIPLAALLPLAGVDAAFVGLQRGVRPADAAALAGAPWLINLGEAFADFGDTVAVIEQLDLVITADSAVAHLAAASGTPTWLLLPFMPDWRWQLGRSDSLWYPSARLFRQARPGDWNGVVAELLAALGAPAAAPALAGPVLAGPVAELMQAGAAAHQAGRWTEAEAAYRQALAADPSLAEAHYRLGILTYQRGRPGEALELIDQAAARVPGNAEYLSNRGVVLTDLGRPADALADLDAAVALLPGFAEAYSNRGNALLALDRLPEALAAYERAVAEKPDYAEAWANRASALAGLGRLEEAAASCDRAIALRPDYADALANRGALRLLTGDFAGGWPDYEWRWHIRRPTSPPRNFAQPQWHGESLAGRTLLLHAEQGFGDTIQFGRYVALAAGRAEAEGGRVVLEVLPSLRELLAGWLTPVQVVAFGEELPPFDLHCPLLSLPLVFGTTAETIPPIPRLRADPARVAVWAPLLPPAGRRRIGLAWSGNPGHANDRRRSVPLAALLPLAGADATFVGLQRGVRPADAAALAEAPWLVNLAEAFSDFGDTAAVIEQLDLVITADSAVAHLAATLGKPTWVLLPFMPDWRWQLGRSDSLWYPSARLFRQARPGDWNGVVAEVLAALGAPAAAPALAGPVLAGPAAEFMQAGLAAHQAGRWAEADTAYRQALAADPSLAEAYHLLGILTYQRGRAREALDMIDQAVARAPTDTGYLSNRGLVLTDLGRPADALASFDAAVALAPGFAEAHSNRGNALRALGRLAEALAAYDRAVAEKPDYAEAWSNRASVLAELGRLEEAAASCDRAIALRPDYADALANRAAILGRLGRAEEALASADAALALRPDLAPAHAHRGDALLALGRPEEALASFDRAVAIAPRAVEPAWRRAQVLNVLGRLEPALAAYGTVLALAPEHAVAWFEQGDLLSAMGRDEDALASLDRAAALGPETPELWCARGLALRGLRRPEEAEAAYARALALRPDHAEAHVQRGFLHLQAGDYPTGWAELDWRGRGGSASPDGRDFQQPVWTGESLAGRTLLLHAEQGFGDTFQLARFIPDVLARASAEGGRVVIEVQPATLPLLARLEGVQTVLPRGAALPAFDLHCPLTSLPRVLGVTPENLPAPAAYLSADPGRAAAWAARLPVGRLAGGRLRVGLVWTGNARARDVERRSLALAALRTLLESGPAFVGLQTELGEDDRVALAAGPALTLLGPEFSDFGDTAAVIDGLDLVITVDTAVAHLAAALGKPTWLLLPYAPDWRWMLDGSASPWYPTMRLFRQPVPGDWAPVLAEVERAMAGLTAGAGPEGEATGELEAGLARQQEGDLAGAEARYRAVLAAEPANPDAMCLLGLLLHQAGRWEEALAEFDAALIVEPDLVDALAGRAAVLQQLGRLEEAVVAYDAAVSAEQEESALWYNRGLALGGLGRAEAALENFERAVALAPDLAAAWAGRGTALLDLDRPEAALESLGRALTLAPDDAEAWSMQGVVLARLLRFDEAEAAFDRALELRPELDSARVNKAFALLTQGRLAEGWPLYEARALAEPSEAPRWEGESLAGRTLLLQAEQGIGDTLQFCRYVPLVAGRAVAEGGRVVLEVQPSVQPLLAGMTDVEVLARGDALPPFDAQCPLLSLPLLFGTTLETVPGAGGYLRADPARVATWAPLLGEASGGEASGGEGGGGEGGGRRVGLVWAGRAEHPGDRHRSLPFAALAPLAETLAKTGACFVSLQAEVPERDRADVAAAAWLTILPVPFGDFADTAAVLAQLDLVITVDTAVAHLAGALGRPTWVLLPHAPEWRWLLGREDSPWYASMRLFRQGAPGDWAGVLARVAAALDAAAPDGTVADAAGLVREGEAALGAGRAEAALDLFGRALEADAELEAAYAGRGAALAELGRTEAALASYDQLLALNPKHGAGWARRGAVLRRLGRERAAAASFARAEALGVATEPPPPAPAPPVPPPPALSPAAPAPVGLSPFQLLQLGIGHLQAGRLAEAETVLRQAHALAPEDADVLHLLGLAAYQDGRPAEAAGLLGRSLALRADNPAVLNNHGLVLTDLKRPAEALDNFERALAAAPGFVEAHLNRGNALRELGRREEALAAYARAAELRPGFAEAWSNHGITLVDLGRPQEALASLERALAVQPSLAAAHGNRGLALAALGRRQEALASIDQALALAPDDAELQAARRDVLARISR